MNIIPDFATVKLEYNKIQTIEHEDSEDLYLVPTPYSAIVTESLVLNLREALKLKFPDYKKEIIRRELVGLVGNLAVKSIFGQSVEDAEKMLLGYFTDNPSVETEFLNGSRYVIKTARLGIIYRFPKDYTKSEGRNKVIFAHAEENEDGSFIVSLKGWMRLEKLRYWLEPTVDGLGRYIPDQLGVGLSRLCGLEEDGRPFNSLSSISELLTKQPSVKQSSSVS